MFTMQSSFAIINMSGVVAHLVERDIRIVEVGGSSPLGSKIQLKIPL